MTVFVKRHRNNVVLCYHGCVRTRIEALTFREHFDDWVSQIKMLKEQGYTFVSPGYYRQWYEGLVTPPTPIACCQIDDGLASITLICDYMVKEGIPFALALIGRRLRKRIPEGDFISWAKISEYVATGLCSIMNHTYNLHNLCLSKNPSTNLIEPTPIMGRPCWVDDGDVIFRDAGDTRYYWDFSHIDGATWGFPIWGTDPYDGVTPITSSFTFQAKATFTMDKLRLWCALARPAGGGYNAVVEIRINGILRGTVTITPTQYTTRSQWLEREYATLNLSSTQSIVSGQSYTVQLKTLNAGSACMLAYAVPDFSGNFSAVTNCRSLTRGKLGADYADFPANVSWPARVCAIISASTGNTVSDAAYQAYVAADVDAENDAVSKWLNPVWTESKPPFNENSALEVYGLIGTYAAGQKADTYVFFGTPAVTSVVQSLRYKQTRHLGRRYPAVVDVYISTTGLVGTYTKIARFVPGWEDYKWTEFDITPTTFTAGVPVWLRFQTLNANQNNYAIDPATESAETIADLQNYGMSIGLIRGLIDAPTVKAFVDPPGTQYTYVTVDGQTVISTRRGPIATHAVPAPSAIPQAVVQSVDFPGIDSYPAQFHTDSNEFWFTPYADNRLYGYPMIGAWSASTVAPAQTMTQIAYPFGSYYDNGTGTISAQSIDDISPVLKSVLIGRGLNAGYTIYPVRNDVKTAFREPACRHTAHTLGRILVYGDVPPQTTINSIGMYTGEYLEDVQHEGADWQISIEPDAAGNATIKESIQALKYVAFDAYFFRPGGVIANGVLNDGGTYLDIVTQTATMTGTITGATSGATATVAWNVNEAAYKEARVNPISGTFLPNEAITWAGGSALLGPQGATLYADDKKYLECRGVLRMLIISNYDHALGDISITMADTVVALGASSPYIAAITSVAVSGGWDGVTCNLEAIPQARRAQATAFYIALSASLRAAGKLLHCTAPSRTGTSYDTGSEWWWGWCDHNEIAKYVHAMKVMTYTESGPGTPAGPHMPDDIFEQCYNWVRGHVEERLWPRLVIGVNSYGHIWDGANATYCDFHTGLAQGILSGAEITAEDGELTWSRFNKTAWFGGPNTLRRAAKKASLEGYGGIGVWKGDDGDKYEMYPKYPTLGRVRMTQVVDQQFPPEWSWGAEGGPVFSTSVIEVDSGLESRNAAWGSALRRYNLSRDLHDAAVNDQLRTFFMLRQGRAIGFRFKDWSDFKATSQVIGTGNALQTGFQLIERSSFTDPVNATTSFFDRKITRPVVGTVSIFLNGVLQSSGFSVNHSTGLVTFTVPPGNGVSVTATFEFDVPVRFESDFLNVRFDKNFGLYSWSGVGFREVRE